MKIIGSLALVAALALSSCNSTHWTKSQAAELPSVAFASPTKKADSYKKPVKLSPRSAKIGGGIAFTSGLVGGFIGGGLGAAAVIGAAAADQKKFEAAYPEQIRKIETSLNHRIEDDYAKRMEQELKNIPFFANRLRKDSPHSIKSTVVQYALTRVNNDEPMRFRATVLLGTTLTSTSGKDLLKGTLASGNSSTEGTLDDFANNKKLLDKSFQEASVNAAENYANVLRTKVEKVGP